MRDPILLPLFLLAASAPAMSQGTTLYSTDFTTLEGWTVSTGCTGLPWTWAADATPADFVHGPYVSAPASLNFNDGVDIGGGSHGGPSPCGWATSGPIDLSAATGVPHLRFWAAWECEADCGWDILSIAVRPAGGGDDFYSAYCLNFGGGPWREFDVVLDGSWGTVEIEFGFDTVDGWVNEGAGAFIDDLRVVDEPELFCVGDGSEGPCPCGNESAPGAGSGCGHSQGAAGTLRAVGMASLSDDTLTLLGTGMPDQPVLYFQAATQHAPVPFGDGLKCTGGPFVRLGIAVNSSGSSTFPGPGDLSISLEGMVGAPGVRHYQARYRDPAAFCTADNFNYTNALTILWLP